ncbi:hypothetical protein RRG08_003313 [Elysia crispata]|uniref:Uncharacterized protein n=1 Tax=Elysia crispata TaxID=231223 RepID=A0AAE1DKW9_9GAST|nr:hypothetical protein RRG08_003313 [Elysia crispata]
MVTPAETPDPFPQLRAEASRASLVMPPSKGGSLCFAKCQTPVKGYILGSTLTTPSKERANPPKPSQNPPGGIGQSPGASPIQFIDPQLMNWRSLLQVDGEATLA